MRRISNVFHLTQKCICSLVGQADLWNNRNNPTFVLQTEPGEDIKYGSLLANLQERVIQTDQGMVVLSSQMSPGTTANTDLSTLASVVTTLATMSKEAEDHTQAAAEALVSAGESQAMSSETMTPSDSVAKAFDTLAKACQSPVQQVEMMHILCFC